MKTINGVFPYMRKYNKCFIDEREVYDSIQQHGVVRLPDMDTSEVNEDDGTPYICKAFGFTVLEGTAHEDYQPSYHSGPAIVWMKIPDEVNENEIVGYTDNSRHNYVIMADGKEIEVWVQDWIEVR